MSRNEHLPDLADWYKEVGGDVYFKPLRNLELDTKKHTRTCATTQRNVKHEICVSNTHVPVLGSSEINMAVFQAQTLSQTLSQPRDYLGMIYHRKGG